MIETNRIELKRELTPEVDLEKEVVAFLNYKDWDKRALREAVINAIVHNDYSFEVSPKFEIFPDRLEITSAGRLPETMSKEEFFEGISIPRNKELMRIYRDLELVESLGFGVPRIVRVYGKDCFKFMDNFTRLIFPANGEVTAHVTAHVTAQVEKLLQVINGEMDRDTLQKLLGVADRTFFRKHYLVPAIEGGHIELAIPSKPTSSKQKYKKVIRP
ncbi:MAG: Fic family protein [Phocaeicola sp.]